MAEPTVTVRKIAEYRTVQVLGTDGQGRVLVRCPGGGCGDTAHVDADGTVVCPTCTALQAALARMMAEYEAAIDV